MEGALITGGSKGLGRCIAEALARRHFNLLLIARNQSDLEIAKEELENAHSVQVEIFATDLSLTESADQIYNWCIGSHFKIKIFCYCAGVGGSKDFQNLPSSELRRMIRVNLESAIVLCYLLTPLLKQTTPSRILLIGSMAGFAPLSIKSVYSATKSALHSFSYSLKSLLKANRVSVHCASPGPLFTKGSIEKETIRKLGWIGKQMAINPMKAGELIVNAMFRGDEIIVPGRLATFFSWVLRLLPDRMIASITNQR